MSIESGENSLETGRVDVKALGSEYFRIWIVNIFLSIITIGIYSAWAKIRTKKYFSQTTLFKDNSFDYHAKPIPILKGRIIAGIILFLYIYGSTFNPYIGFLGTALFFGTLPFFFIKALKFNFSNTSHRNIRFHLTATVKESYEVFVKNFGIQVTLILIMALIGAIFPGLIMSSEDPNVAPQVNPIFLIITLIISLFNFIYTVVIFPKFYSSILNLIYGKLFYGGIKIEPTIDKKDVASQIMWPYLRVLFTGFGVGVLFFIIGFLTINTVPFVGASLYFLGAMFLYLCIVYAIYKFGYNTFCLVWNNLNGLNGSSSTNLDFSRYLKLIIKNHLLTLITLGLYYPWAKVSMYKLKNESKQLHGLEFEEVFKMAFEKESAISEEIGEAFDLDFEIGL